MEDQDAAAARFLAPIMDQLAALQRQMASVTGPPRPSPADVIKATESPIVVESSFRRASSKDQFKFCRTISGLAEQALDLFDANGALVNRDFIKAIADLSAKRQKLIKLADRSDSGLAMVSHYEADPIAEGSDDEKRIKAAEKQALAQANKASTAARKRTASGLLLTFITMQLIRPI